MKKQTTVALYSLLVVILVVLGVVLAVRYHDNNKTTKVTVSTKGNATLSLSPSSGTYSVGSTFKVNVLENSSQQANAVQANINYDPTSLEVTQIGYGASASSPFTLCPVMQTGAKTGQIIVDCAITGNGLTGSQTVVSISFKVVAAATASALSFTQQSSIIRTSDRQNVWNGQASPASYDLTPATTS